jgi:hypothetical protein
MSLGIYDFPPIDFPPEPVAKATYEGLTEAIAKADRLSFMDRSRLRGMLWFNRSDREAAIAIAYATAKERGIAIPEERFGVGWAAIIAFFIEYILPILLELLNNRRT